MKKTLSMLAILGLVSFIGMQASEAFQWSDLNPAYWGHCPRCEKKKSDCGCQKVKKCDPCQREIIPPPCTTGAAAPCNVQPKKTCDPCDKLQEMNR